MFPCVPVPSLSCFSLLKQIGAAIRFAHRDRARPATRAKKAPPSIHSCLSPRHPSLRHTRRVHSYTLLTVLRVRIIGRSIAATRRPNTTTAINRHTHTQANTHTATHRPAHSFRSTRAMSSASSSPSVDSVPVTPLSSAHVVAASTGTAPVGGTIESLQFDNLAIRTLPIDKEERNFVREVPGQNKGAR